MKPHIFSKMVNEVRDIAKQYGHTEQFRCRVADLLKGYIPVEHGKGIPGAGLMWNHAVPSSRVLKDGERAVDLRAQGKEGAP